jgi:hypothetical protein
MEAYRIESFGSGIVFRLTAKVWEAGIAPHPQRLGRPTMSRAGWSPVGGGNGGHVEMADMWKWRFL